jgi:hypothetical protein
MFNCDGCYSRNWDKDLKSLVNYTFDNGLKGSLLFCGSSEVNNCMLPTVHYMLENISEKELENIKNITIAYFSWGIPLYKNDKEVKFELSSSKELLETFRSPTIEEIIENVTFYKSLEHYQKVGKELGEGGYKLRQSTDDIIYNEKGKRIPKITPQIIIELRPKINTYFEEKRKRLGMASPTSWEIK